MSKFTFPIKKQDNSLQREYAAVEANKTPIIENIVVTEPSVNDVTVNFTRFMVGTYLHPHTGEWMIGYAAFDPVTETIGQFQSERVAGDQEVMRERLTIKQVSLGLFSPLPIKEERKEEIY